jgi:adenylate kinase
MSVAYEARRDDDPEKIRNDQNNANNIRNAAEVAQASGNAYAMAAGTAVKAADKITGGKSTEALGRGITKLVRMAAGLPVDRGV